MTFVVKDGAGGLSIAMRAVDQRHRQRRRANLEHAGQLSSSSREQPMLSASRAFLSRWRILLLAGTVLIPTTCGLYLVGRSPNERSHGPVESEAPPAQSAGQSAIFPEFGVLQPPDRTTSVFVPAIETSPTVEPVSEPPNVPEAEPDHAQAAAPAEPVIASPLNSLDSTPSPENTKEPDGIMAGSRSDAAPQAAPPEAPVSAQDPGSTGVSPAARSTPHIRPAPAPVAASQRRLGQAQLRRQPAPAVRKLVTPRTTEPRGVAQRAAAPRRFVLPSALKPTAP